MLAQQLAANNGAAHQGSAFNQQQALVNGMNAQNGLGNQSSVFNQQQGLANQLQGVANGTGPNPAMAALAQATGNNIAQQSALMAGQRGAGANAGLLARQAAMQGAGIQQNAIGQAANMQAQQSLNAMGALQNQQSSMGNLAGQQVSQQSANQQALAGLASNQISQQQAQQNAVGALTGQQVNQQAGALANYNSGAQGLFSNTGSLLNSAQANAISQQSALNNANVAMQSNVNQSNVGMQSNINNANAAMQSNINNNNQANMANVNNANLGIAEGNQAAQSGAVSGLISGIAKGAAHGAAMSQGGMVQAYADGGDVEAAPGVQPPVPQMAPAPMVQSIGAPAVAPIAMSAVTPEQGAAPEEHAVAQSASTLNPYASGISAGWNSAAQSATSGGQSSSAPAAPQGAPGMPPMDPSGGMMSAAAMPVYKGGIIPEHHAITYLKAMKNPGHKPLMDHQAYARGGDVGNQLKSGGGVPGQASVEGNSLKNDTVKALLSPGEVVIPRSIMESKDPAQAAAAFVASILKKKSLGKH